MESWFEVEYILLKSLNLQPSELDRMDFYRAEILMENAKAWNEKEQEHRKAEEKQQQQSMEGFSPSSMMSSAKNMMKSSAGSMPKLGGNFKF